MADLRDTARTILLATDPGSPWDSTRIAEHARILARGVLEEAERVNNLQSALPADSLPIVFVFPGYTANAEAADHLHAQLTRDQALVDEPSKESCG